MTQIFPDRLRFWWWQRQCLDGSCAGVAPAAILDRTGWARSVGGSGPYLTLYARGGWSRESVDAAAATLKIQELPAARGCTYVVPASDYSLALRAAEPFSKSELNVGRKLGVTDSEVDRLCDRILDVLASGPLDPEEIRSAVGDAARNLGAEGQKKGLTTTLPLALRILQAQGQVRRVPINGRLDQQRYRYTVWSAPKLVPPGEVGPELAKRYFRWIGPATLAEFQAFSGIGARVAKAVVADLGLVPLGDGSERLLFPEDLDAFSAIEVPTSPQYALVGALDGISLLRRNVQSLLREAEPVPQALTGLSELPSNAILDRGRLVGLWEYDPEHADLVWTSFDKPNGELRAAVAKTEAWIREQLGDVRSFSLDSPKSRAPRIARMRELSAAG